jgi:hypothetical protein
MKHSFRKTFLATVLGPLLLAACGGGGDATHVSADVPEPSTMVTPPDVTVAVPAEVSTSPTAATQYVASLSSQPEGSTDALEPVDVPEQIAQDDTAEPV